MQFDIELYRRDIAVASGVHLSVIDVAPERPAHTLVLIHGFGGRARHWEHQIQAFAQGNRVIAPDLRGHGRSSRPARGFDMASLLDDLSALLERLGVEEPFVLVGHSFGGAIASEYAFHHPQRLSHLVLIATAGEYRLNIWLRLLFELPLPLLQLLQPVADVVADASLKALRAIYQRSLSRWQGWTIFPRLQPPVMVIQGERDVVFPRAAFDRVGELVPEDAEVIKVGVSKHMVMLERRDAVNRAIERFVGTAGATSARPGELKADGQYSDWRSGRGVAGLLVDRPWLVHYDAGVPHTIDVPRLPLTRLLDRAARRFPRQPAMLFYGRAISYRSLEQQTDRFANALVALGVDNGTRVFLLLPNVPQLVIAYYATLRLGAIAVMGNPLARLSEITHQVQLSGAEILITLTLYQETAQAIKEATGTRHVIYANFKDYLPFFKRLLFTWKREKAGGHRLRQPLASDSYEWKVLLRRHHPLLASSVVDGEGSVSPDGAAVIQFTGGTTGRPKGVTLSHYNLVANTMQTRAWMPDIRFGHETVVCVVPFSHVYGMTAGMNIAISVGASMILLPSFETRELLEQIRRYRPTIFPGVPAMYVAINNFPGVRKYNLHSIRACISGAAPLPVEVKERFEKLTRGRLVEGYGLSEASPVTHANPLQGLSKPGSIGLPLPNTEARILDLRDGHPLPPGEIGLLVVRGPQVMQGYWGDPRATADLIDRDGWLHTEDIGRMDEDGYFQIISRRQDMWQPEGAAAAFPRDVEEVIYELPEVREVVVVAIANQPIAFVQLQQGSRLPAKTIVDFCRRRLPPSHVPRLVIFVKEFPRSFIGKVLRRKLVSQYTGQIQAEAGTVGDYLAGLEDDE